MDLLVTEHGISGNVAEWLATKAWKGKVETKRVGRETFKDDRVRSTIVIGVPLERTLVETIHEETSENNKRFAFIDYHDCSNWIPKDSTYCSYRPGENSASIAWSVFAKEGMDKPWIVEYAGGDRSLPFYEEIKCLMEWASNNHYRIDRVFNKGLYASAELGKPISEYKSQLIRECVDRAKKVRIGGFEVPGVNATMFEDDVGYALNGDPFSVTWSDSSETGRVYKIWGERWNEFARSLGAPPGSNEVVWPPTEPSLEETGINYLDVMEARIRCAFMRWDGSEVDCGRFAIEDARDEINEAMKGISPDDPAHKIAALSPYAMYSIERGFGPITVGELAKVRKTDIKRKVKWCNTRLIYEIMGGVGIAKRIIGEPRKKRKKKNLAEAMKNAGR